VNNSSWSQGEPHAESAPSPGPNGVTIVGLFCEPCTDVARKLKDRAVNCGIIGCSRKWTWKADDQIQAFAAGKPNEPPRRMCAECRAEFGKLGDARSVPHLRLQGHLDLDT